MDDIKEVIKNLPELPGIYKYFDGNDNLLYIGKAKSLKKRVSSYFNKIHYESRRTAVMVKKIVRIEFTIVQTETDALLLENSLIKEFQPRYNINLKDDKTYPFIRITKERFPKVYPTRNPVKDGSEYFGPYASLKMMHTILGMIKQLYPLRNCNLVLSESNINSGKFRVCLEYHIGNCKGPCENHQTEEDYLQSIEQVRKILRGNINEVIHRLKDNIKTAADTWEFETAERLKRKLDILEQYQGKSAIVNQSIHNVDVVTIASDNRFAFANYMKIVNGMIIQTQTIELKKQLDETESELLGFALIEMRQRYLSNSREIIVPFLPDFELEDATFVVPKLGDKKKLLELSLKNALFYKKEKLEQYEKLNPELKTERLLAKIQSDLRLTELPYHMECFDNSNLQGTNPVSACVVFKNGRASKKDYRHFNVKTVTGPNDFATMQEVLTRRYSRVLSEGETLPQLIIVDGGKGQLSASVETLKSIGIYGKVAIIGIAKRLEELYYPEDPFPLLLDKKSETLKIIQQMRDEAHRFGITHHRKRRDNSTLATELTSVKGIGEETARLLLSQFKSLKKVKLASEKELTDTIGQAKTRILLEYFKSGF
jgi:excinuclease ABC subunit C